MKKVKIVIILVFMVCIFTGCSIEKKTITNKLTESLVEETSKEIPKPKEVPKQDKVVDSAIPEIKEIKEVNGFVLLSSLNRDIVIDLKYATNDNFTKKVIYPNSICVLRKSTTEKLVKANAQLNKLGFKIKVWDAYRPIYVQQIFWDIVKDSRFVANPKNGGSIHNKGCAVDATIVNTKNNEVIMPSKFDDFSTNAYRSNSKMGEEAKKNMNILTKCMVDNGFTTLDTEWWHFDDVDSRKHKIIDIDLKLFK